MAPPFSSVIDVRRHRRDHVRKIAAVHCYLTHVAGQLLRLEESPRRVRRSNVRPMNISRPITSEFTSIASNVGQSGATTTTKTIEKDEFKRRLIDAVRHHRTLWDHRTNGYCNSAVTETTWRAVADELGREWTICRRVWNKLRSYFVEKRGKLPPSGGPAYEEARSKIKWPYYRSMEFLNDTLNKRRSTSSNPLATQRIDATPAVSQSGTGPQERQTRRPSHELSESIATSIRDFTDKLCSALANAKNDEAANDDRAATSLFGRYISDLMKRMSAGKRRRFEAKVLRLMADTLEEQEEGEDS